MPDPIYVFLDSNIIFSAAYKDDSPFLELWDTPGILVVSSLYAANEVRRNCRNEQHLKRLEALLEQTMIVSDPFKTRCHPTLNFRRRTGLFSRQPSMPEPLFSLRETRTISLSG